ncbi:MAG: insulinase family protein [Verrucomicrobia bacterium]|nr:insulinase family protein [Verrucomicrobiota bacterium]
MLTPGSLYRGFLVRQVTKLPPPLAAAIELEHRASGARLLHLFNDDPENLFCIAFPTPPADDTGLPHILEHSVLGGSHKYPVRDPFFELVKMSMATFINAMTFWDRTVYPVASNVKQDLFNLAEVYFDAVFHPLLTENIFKREGHHLAPAGEDRLTVSGIVYNEMKGVFSNPEYAMEILALRHLFPDTVYGREAGGDPRRIPDLTFEQFRAFHSAFYHPARSRFVCYGNIATTDYLDFLADRLEDFSARDAAPIPVRQPRWQEPRAVTETYAIGHEEPATGRTYLMLDWLAGDAAAARDTAALYMLSLLLFGHDAAPLKKALVDSKLGEDVIACGAEIAGLEMMFRAGLKGTEPDRAAAFENLVLATLRELADRAFPAEAVDAAFHQAGYEYQEIPPGYPLHVLFRVLQAWTYSDDPLGFLGMRAALESLRKEAAADPLFFSRLIRERLIENTHRLRLTLQPDREHQARLDMEFEERMKMVRAGLDEAAMRRIAEEAETLERESGTPNPPEALARLPQLRLQDLPEAPDEIPTRLERVGPNLPLLINDVPSNGVAYVHLDFNLDGLPTELRPYLPRFTDALTKMGAAGLGYEETARRRAARFGGLRAWTWFQTRADDPAASLARLRIEMKTLDDRIEPALELLGNLLFGLDPRDEVRLRDVIIQARTWERTEKIQGGTTTPMLHAGRGFSLAGHLRELCDGLPQLFLLEELAGGFDRRVSDLMARLEAVRDFLLNPRRLAASFTGPDRSREVVGGVLKQWSERMRDAPIPAAATEYPAFSGPVREGLAAPLQVAHCALVLPAPHCSDPDEPLLALAAHLVAFDYILPEIRFKGNAYGAGCRHDPFLGTLAFSSFRDPHVARTIEVFGNTAKFVRQAPWSRTDLDRAVIGKARDDLKPIRPAEATGLSLHRWLAGLTPERRAERYRRRRQATPEEVRRAMLDSLEAGRARGAVCVMAGREKLEEANRQMSSPLSIEDVLK